MASDYNGRPIMRTRNGRLITAIHLPMPSISDRNINWARQKAGAAEHIQGS